MQAEPSKVLLMGSKEPLARRGAQRRKDDTALAILEMQYPSQEPFASLRTHISGKRWKAPRIGHSLQNDVDGKAPLIT